ncbi:CBM96 family carbohydrate-binding protein [Cohnella fermenti]|uniref:DNRLRE domain-containing protein n=1 Tax=Cohnella fermenti TaxID=2565925 RepID=A0A4S4BG20_9BACL|nr:DNRLRE domain-containing protein [Cohnella fermenti]THF73342.1 DNRLRE domain-containing protein [Cohnella fermenti]
MVKKQAAMYGLLLALVCTLVFNSGDHSASASGDVYYVSADEGSDTTGDGSLAHPWQTIQKAADTMVAGDTCYIREGVYREAVVPANSGTESNPITYRSYAGETATIVGTEAVTGWVQDSGDIYKAPAILGLGSGNQVFADGEMLLEARWPNNTGSLMKQIYATMNTGTATTVTYSALPVGLDPVGAHIWFRGGSGWAGLDSEITAYDAVTGKMTMKSVSSSGTYYDARAGNAFYLWGKKELLDTAGEWWYDSAEEMLYVWAPGGGTPDNVEAKARQVTMDFSGRAYIHVIGVHTKAGSIVTDDASNHILLQNMKMEYVSQQSENHSGRPDAIDKGIQLNGSDNEINSSEIAYSSSGLVLITGSNQSVVNSYLHDGDYAGTWGGLVTVQGQGHYIGYNTMERAGRDVINLNTVQTIIEHNDLSAGAMVCYDTAMIYTPNTDGMWTEIRYNKIHDIDASANLGMGIYLDNSSSEFLIHHNVIWNIPNSDPIRLNTPSNYNLVYNNTLGPNTKALSTGGSRFAGDLFGNRLFNNIINDTIRYPNSYGYAAGNNLFVLGGQDPQFIDPDNGDFRIGSGSPAIDMGMVVPGITDSYTGSSPDVGAYEAGAADFRTGHDFNDEPTPSRTFSAVPFRNLVVNYGFETLMLAPWTKVADTVQVLNAGSAAWTSETADSRFQKGALTLQGANAEAEQTVEGLSPDTTYTFSIWSKTSDDSAAAEFGVRDYGGPSVTRSVYGTGWQQTTFDFTTGPSATSAALFVRKVDRAMSVTPNLWPLDAQTIGISAATAEYDVTSFVEAQYSGDGVASLIVKVDPATAAKRITFSSSESGASVNRPVLIVRHADSTTETLTASEDTEAKSSSASQTTNYGSQSSLNASYFNANYIENMYLKFDLSGISTGSPVESITLQLHPASRSSSDSVSTIVYGFEDDSWQEGTLNWTNRPEEIAPPDGIVFIDDVGLLLPLAASEPEDAVRDRILAAEGLVAQYADSDAVSAAIIDDLEDCIADTIELIEGAHSEAELNDALAAISAKIDAFQARIELVSLIGQAQDLYDQSAEGSLSGQYIPGAKADLLSAIGQARIVADSASAEQADITAEQGELAAALETFKMKVILEAVPLLDKADLGAMLLDTSNWSSPYSSDGGYSLFDGTISKYNEIIGDNVFTMDLLYHYVDGAEWPGIVLRSQNATLPVLGSGDTSYFIVFKQNTWELQKRINGTQAYLNSYPNTLLQSDISAKLDVGAIDVIGGVRVFCYVDGVKVFDFIDTVDPIPPGYMGIVAQGGKSDGIRVRGTARPEASLQGPNTAGEDEAVALNVRLDNLATSSVYGFRLDLNYDSDSLDFTDATSLVAGLDASVTYNEEPGSITIIVAAASPVAISGGQEILRLDFETKETAGSTSLAASAFVITDSGNNEIDATAYAKRIWIE